MNKKHLLIVLLFIIILFGFCTVILSNQPFGLLFNITLYLFVTALILFLLVVGIRLLSKKIIATKILGVLICIIGLILIVVTILISYEYRILYFKSSIPRPTKSEWQEDLKYLSYELQSVHPDIYSMVSKAKLDSLEREIHNRISCSEDSDILMDLFRFIALPNDAHTFPFIFFPCFDLHNLPIQIYGFQDDWYVVDAGRGYKELIGKKIVQIGSQDINEIFDKYPVLLGAENSQSKRERFTYMVVIPEWLKYHGIIKEIDKVAITYFDEDNNLTKENLPSYKYYFPFLWSNVIKIDNNEPHVFTNPRKDWYNYTPIENDRILYIEYHQCDNQKGKETVEEFANSLDTYIKENNFERYIIDLRSNDGGNSNVNVRLIDVISKSDKMNQYGNLYVLIGRRTFSAAVMFANQLQMLANPIFIGEGTSQGTIFFGGPKLIELPNSRLVFGISSRKTISGLSFDNRNMIKPDIEIEYSIDDFLTNSDPTLVAAINHKPNERPVKKYLDKSDEILGEYVLNGIDYLEIYQSDNELYLKITDYVPNSLAKFSSPLFANGDNTYLTKIDSLYIEVIQYQNNNEYYLNYLDKKIPIKKVIDPRQIAMKMLRDGDITSGIKVIRDSADFYINRYQDLEQILNSLGYQLMGEYNILEAIMVFKANVFLFPESSNVYDSLAEAYMKNKESELAINYYKKSLELNPQNNNAVNMLEKLIKN